MIRFGLAGRGTGRRRRKCSLPLIAAVVGGFIFFDTAERWYVKRQAWAGHVVKSYQERPFWSSRRRSSARHNMWDVRTADGSVKSIHLYSRALWDRGHVGDYVVKTTGELDPKLLR